MLNEQSFTRSSISALFLSFILSAFAAFIISMLGNKLSLIDNPNERSSHSTPTSRGGGIGICISFLIVGIFIVKNYLFTLMASLIGLLGFLEDRFSVSSKFRLIFQFVMSVLVILFFLGFSKSISELFLFLFWIIFITGTANFYNFMDGINGIAGLTGIVGFGLMAYFSYFIANDHNVSIMSFSLAVACLGFLPFNFPKAKVFMGDIGSVFLGFVFASFVVKLSVNISIFLCLVMFLCTFYADAMVTIFYRWRRGENLTKAHRSHLYQYMSNELGWAHWKVSILYATIQFIFGFLAIWTYRKNLTVQFVLVTVYGVLFVFSYKRVKAIKLLKSQQK